MNPPSMPPRTIQSPRRVSGLVATLLAGLLLAGLPAAVAAQTAPAGEVLLEVKRFEIVGDNPLSAAETAATLAPFLGVHKSVVTLEAAATALENHLRDLGYSFHRVIVPAQKPTAGVVRLEMFQFPLANVEVTGQNHFSPENIRRSLPGLVSGTSPDINEMSRELGLANEHPSKRLTVVLKESTRADALDAEIRVRDSSPSLAFASLVAHTRDAYDVINQNTGYARLTMGYQNSNLFDRDHALTASFTTSPEHFDRVAQYGLFYAIPFYGYNTSLQLHYTRSDVNTGAIGIGGGGAFFNVNGRGEFMGARVTHSLTKIGEFAQNVSLGIEQKHFDGNVGFGGVPIPQSASGNRPLTLRYAARTDQLWGGFGVHAEYITNLPGGPGNTDAGYQAARAGSGATLNWNAIRYGLDASYLAGTWNLSARFRGQHTRSLLLPGEQFGIGGVASVRGLREREFTGDMGYTFTLEALGPALVDTLRPAFFIDHGYASLRKPASTDITAANSETAASIGVGVRWNWKRQLDVAVDLAHVLNGIGSSGTIAGTTPGASKLLLSVFYRF